ncbi:unnamed protein product [Adineta steineri]|uniref:BZIP domain-containing protein n=1 Tax=Adineta steineri TaxID=433720 RepID=A0A818UCG6_9BILA|nr:unnamed protein product [Adineta steineri]CAF3698672.1 unnamed protein product [Adineta steineri]
MNHTSHMHQQQEQQQQQQQINETQHTHSNSDSPTHATLTRSDSTSTVILEEEETSSCRRNRPSTQPPLTWSNLSIQLRSFLKTSGLFNKDLESFDKWNELFTNGNSFSLQRLLSEAGVNDVNIDMNELKKLDSTELLNARTLSEFLRSASFDQLMATSAAQNPEVLSNPLVNACSSSSFSDLQPLSPELTTNNTFRSPLLIETDNSLLCPSIDSTTTTTSNQNALNAFEHDHDFFPKKKPNTTNSKRTSTRGSRRTSSRIQSRAVCSTTSEANSTKSKRTRNINRATDIKTSDDLSYYLERRRKNNEASKMSRAARREKFGSMDQQCEEYERVNTELRMKISTLETVTTSLKSGLVNNFQRKSAV